MDKTSSISNFEDIKENFNPREITGNKFTIEEEEDSELESSVKKIILLKRSYVGTAIFGFFCLITLGLYYVFSKWWPGLRIKLCFSSCNLANASFIELDTDDGNREIVSFGLNNNQKYFYVFRYRKYILNNKILRFEPVKFVLDSMNYIKIHEKFQAGLNIDKVESRLALFGENQTKIDVKSYFQIFLEEVLSAFYFFQWFSCLIWFIDDYWIYAIVILIMSFTSIIATIYETRTNMTNIQKMSFYETDIVVFRENKLDGSVIKSSQLVPGDLIEVPQNKPMPCDIVLLTGSTIMNEAMLTGESVPVVKNPLPKVETPFSSANDKQHILFSGTICLQTRTFGKEKKVLGIILRTGFYTKKGQMIRSILYPKPFVFKFDKDSFYYLLVMFIISFIGFIYTMHYFIVHHIEIGEIIIKGLELFTNAIPPALPTCMSIGIQFALGRLKKDEIFCTHPNRVNVAGRVKIMCFDKTGTLTEDGLTVKYLMPVEYKMKQPEYQQPKEDCLGVLAGAQLYDEEFNNESLIIPELDKMKNSTQQLYLTALATCHSLTNVGGELIGDPLDVKMFDSSGWKMIENHDFADSDRRSSEVYLASFIPSTEFRDKFNNTNSSNIQVVKRFDFVSALQRMSVVVKHSNEDFHRLHITGSPERISELCLPHTVPIDFLDTLHNFTESGYRVLALGCRIINLTYLEVLSLKRADAECDLIFLGLLIVENKLKPITTSIIKTLKQADVRTIMITGDNALTAVSVARECRIIPTKTKVFLGEISETNKDEVEWKDLETKLHIDLSRANSMIPDTPYTLGSKTKKVFRLPKLPEINMGEHKFCLAVSGKAFDLLYSEMLAAKEKGDAAAVLKFNSVVDSILVFARMQPDGKVLAVNCFQELYKNKNYMVGFCGDGANDCGALKSADVGLSLSQAEASIAAPFTSKVQDIKCVVKLLREGRAALATSFQSFKFMSFYSMSQFSGVLFLYKFFQEYTDREYLYTDLFTVFIYAILMTRHGSYEKLSKELPGYSLLTVTVLFSTFGCIIMNQLMMIYSLVYISESPNFITQESTEIKTNSLPHLENMIVFIITNAGNATAALAFTTGKPFRKAFYHNYLFTAWIALTVAYNLYFVIHPDYITVILWQLKPFSYPDIWRVFGITIIAHFLLLFYERVVINMYLRKYCGETQQKESKKIKNK